MLNFVLIEEWLLWHTGSNRKQGGAVLIPPCVFKTIDENLQEGTI